MPEVLPVGVPPEEAIRFFAAKGRRATFDWPEMLHEEHAADFTVAKMGELDLLDATHRAVRDALAKGRTFEQFRQELEPTLRAAGWWGRQERTDPLTGERRMVQLGSTRRLQIIYDTNLRTAYAAGQWERIERVKAARPWLRYVAVLDARTRPLHRAWHGTVLPVDHPWWRTHYPPNGWRCRCGVQQLSDRDLARWGWRPSAAAPDDGPPLPWTNPRTGETLMVPRGIDPGWGYNVGIAGREAAAARQILERTVAAPPEIAAGAVAPLLPRLASALVPDFAAWVDGLDAARPRGERRVVGVLSEAVLRRLTAGGTPPASAAVTVTDQVLAHLLRDAKAARGTALPAEVIRRLPSLLAAPQAVLWDKVDPALLYVFDVPGDPRLGKLVVRVDMAEKARDADAVRRTIVTNAVRSGGAVDRSNLTDPVRYELIEGAL